MSAAHLAVSRRNRRGVGIDRALAMAVAGLVLVLGGCEGRPPSSGLGIGSAASPSVASAAVAPTAVKPPAAMAMPNVPDAGPPLPPLAYESKGRRDPFTAVSASKDNPGLSLSGLKLAGVIRGRTLLALVEAPDGLGYILKPGDALGDRRVTDITPTSVVFAVAGMPGQPATTVALRLGPD